MRLLERVQDTEITWDGSKNVISAREFQCKYFENSYFSYSSVYFRIAPAYYLRFAQEMRMLTHVPWIFANSEVKEDILFVVAQQTLEVIQELESGDKVHVYEWITQSIEKGFVFQVELYRAHGKLHETLNKEDLLVGRISVTTIAISKTTRKAISLPISVRQTVDRLLFQSKAVIPLPVNYPKVLQEPEFCYEIKVRFTDLDINNHVTHARYLDWIEDALAVSHFKICKAITKVTIEYKAEARLNELLEVVIGRVVDTNTLAVAIRRNRDKVLVTKASVVVVYEMTAKL